MDLSPMEHYHHGPEYLPGYEHHGHSGHHMPPHYFEPDSYYNWHYHGHHEPQHVMLDYGHHYDPHHEYDHMAGVKIMHFQDKEFVSP